MRKVPSEPVAKRNDGFTYRAVAPVPTTYREDDRSVEFVLSTEAPATVFDPERFDFVDEVLLQDGMVTPSNGQVPLIDSHDRATVTNILGSVRGFRREGGQSIGRAFFARDQKSYDSAQKVRDGHIDAVSVGYAVEDAVWVPEGERTVVNGREYQGPLKVSKRWHLREVSLVAVGADQFAKVRSEATAEQPEKQAEQQEETQVITSTAVAEAETLQEEKEMPTENQTQNTPPAPVVDLEQVKAEARRAEIERAKEIRKACAILGDASVEADLIERGVSIDEARKIVIEKAAAKSQPLAQTQKVEVGETDAEKFREAATDAFIMRSGMKIAKPAQGADQMRGAGFISIARESLRRAGVDTRWMTNTQIIDTVLSRRNFGQGTSDFDSICDNVATKTAMMGYTNAPQSFRAWCKIGSLPNFLAAKRVRASDIPAMAVVPEGAQVGVGVMSDTGENITLATYAVQLTFTRQMMINDSADALQIMRQFGARAADTVNALPYAVLEANANLSDSVALFSTATTRGPIAGNKGTQGAISDTTLTELFKLMHSQTGPKGLKLNIKPRYLLTGSAYMNAARLFCGAVMPVASTTYGATIPNVNYNILEPIADANISGNHWYLTADPAQVDTVEVAFLDGVETPTITEVENPNGILGKTYLGFIDATAKALDFRGLACNI